MNSPVKSIISSSSRPLKWPEWFTLAVGGILAFDGISKVLSLFEQFQVLNFADPILGITSRQLLPIVGIVEIIIASFCLFSNKRILSLMLVAWLATNFLVYVISLYSMGCHLPYGWINHHTVPGNLSPFLSDWLVVATSAIMIIGGGTAIWVEHKSAEAAIFQKMSCPACGGHIKFETANLGQKIPCPHCRNIITLRVAENIKMSCFFCLGHIEFPAHALGRKMPCPHCRNDITLKELE